MQTLHFAAFFPHLITAVADWMSTILWHIMWPQGEFRMHFWNVLHTAHWKYRTQKLRKNRHLHTITQLCLEIISSQRRHVSTIEKNLSNTNTGTSSTCHHNMLNLSPLMAEICWRVLAPQQISTGFASWLRYCTDIAQLKSTKLCRMFGRLLGWYTIYIFGGSCPLTEFCPLQIYFA